MNAILKRYHNLQFSWKIALSGILLFIPMFMLLVLFYQRTTDDIHFVQDEITGAHYIPAIYDVQATVGEHRELMSEFLNGKRTLAPAIANAQQKIAHAWKALQQSDQQYGARLQTGDRVDHMLATWEKLRDSVEGLSEVESFARHTQLIDQLVGFTAYVGDTSKLILDPELDSYYLMDLDVLALPALLNDTSKSLSRSITFANNGVISQAEQIELAVLLDRLVGYQQRVNGGLSTVYAHDSIGGLEQALSRPAEELNNTLNQYVDQINKGLVKVDRSVKVDASALFAQGTAVLKNTLQFAGIVNQYLIDVLHHREEVEISFLKMRLMIFALFTVLSVVVGVLSIRYLTRRIKEVVKVFSAIGRGQYENELGTIYKDEVGEIQSSLESMQGALKENVSRIQQSAREGAKITQALESVKTGVILTDELGEIYFINRACTELLQLNKEDIRQSVEQFDPSRLIGFSISDALGAQASVKGITDMKMVHLTFNEVHMDVFIVPTLDEQRAVLGYAIEVVDRTLETQVENKINYVVMAATLGDLSGRLNIQTNNQFFCNLASTLNELLSVSDNVIQDVSKLLLALSEGDLTKKIERDYEGTFGELKLNANTTVERLYSTMKDILSATNQVTLGVKEIANGNIDLSARTEEQASSLEETASSMEEMTGTIRQNQGRAEEASEKASLAQSKSNEGKEIVDEAIIAMGKINESSRKIVEIISVIDEIAFQTNLLALNAAVEAARAGDQGRGFAVVASEVRTLAQRSAEAAKEIKSLIQDSVSKIEEGSRLVNSTGSALEEINAYSQEVGGMMAQLSSSAKEQSEGVSQVNTSITEMDLNTQKNAALVEETTATSNALSELALDLAKRMTFFNLGNASSIFAGADRKSSGGAQGSHYGNSAPLSSAVASQSVVSHLANEAPPTEAIVSPLNTNRSVADDDEWDEF